MDFCFGFLLFLYLAWPAKDQPPSPFPTYSLAKEERGKTWGAKREKPWKPSQEVDPILQSRVLTCHLLLILVAWGKRKLFQVFYFFPISALSMIWDARVWYDDFHGWFSKLTWGRQGFYAWLAKNLGFLILFTVLHHIFEDCVGIFRPRLLLETCILLNLVSFGSSFSFIGPIYHEIWPFS